MDYRQAIDYLSSFTNWERTSAQAFAAANFDLRRVHSLLARLGNPHLGRKTVHIAGSKGKGSIAAMTAAVLSAATDRGIGLYTSPHLHTFCERIAVDGQPIAQPDFARLTEAVTPAAAAENADGRFGQLTTFELLTALAFLYVREREAGWLAHLMLTRFATEANRTAMRAIEAAREAGDAGERARIRRDYERGSRFRAERMVSSLASLLRLAPGTSERIAGWGAEVTAASAKTDAWVCDEISDAPAPDRHGIAVYFWIRL